MEAIEIRSYIGPTLMDILKELEKLGDRLGVLEDRLNPVLGQPIDKPDSPGKPTPESGSSTTAQEALSILRIIRVRTSQVENIIERIEV